MKTDPIIQLREFRKFPFCWQDKIVLRNIRKLTTQRQQPYLRSTYMALTEIASDRESDKIDIYIQDIARYAGVSTRRISIYLKTLKKLKVIYYEPQDRLADGTYTTIKIHLLDSE